MQIRLIAFLFTFICFLLAFAFFTHNEPAFAETDAYQPAYTLSGKLIRPAETERWIFVGSNLGLNYEKRGLNDTPSFHNIYISPFAYESYQTTGKFPDKTMLLLDRYEREGKSPQNSILTDGYFNGKRTGFEIAVKDSTRPNRRENSKAEWAYYAFGGDDELRQTASAFPDAACQACHAEHAGDDHVWVQFYPVLRRAKN